MCNNKYVQGKEKENIKGHKMKGTTIMISEMNNKNFGEYIQVYAKYGRNKCKFISPKNILVIII